MAGGARGRGCSDRIFDFQSSYRSIHDLDLGASNIWDLGHRTLDIGP